jgi:hypothetical protein
MESSSPITITTERLNGVLPVKLGSSGIPAEQNKAILENLTVVKQVRKFPAFSEA